MNRNIAKKSYEIRVHRDFYEFLRLKQEQFFKKYGKKISLTKLTELIAKLLWTNGEAEIIAIKPTLKRRRKKIEVADYDFFKWEI